MEIGQFVWSGQTVVLPERDEYLRGIQFLINVKGELFWKLFRTSHRYRVLSVVQRITLQTRTFAGESWRCNVKFV